MSTAVGWYIDLNLFTMITNLKAGMRIRVSLTYKSFNLTDSINEICPEKIVDSKNVQKKQ